MRLLLHFELSDNKVSVNYRSSILSFIKYTIEKTDRLSYDKFYGVNKMKSFTFSTYLPSTKILNNNYELVENKFSLQFSFLDPADFIVLYNAFNSHRGEKYPLENNTIMTLKDISLVNKKIITSDTIKIKFLSPLVVRKHNKETNKDIYLSFEDNDFQIELNKSIALMSERLNFENIRNTEIDFKHIQNESKKTVVPFKKILMKTTFGKFIIKGDTTLLNYLYKSGMGSRRSEGFGMFDVIKDGVDE